MGKSRPPKVHRYSMQLGNRSTFNLASRYGIKYGDPTIGEKNVGRKI